MVGRGGNCPAGKRAAGAAGMAGVRATGEAAGAAEPAAGARRHGPGSARVQAPPMQAYCKHGESLPN